MSWDALLELAKILGLPLTLTLVAVWAFATGRVIPRSTHDRVVADRDAQILQQREIIAKKEAREEAYLDMLLAGTRGLEQATTALKEQRRRA